MSPDLPPVSDDDLLCAAAMSRAAYRNRDRVYRYRFGAHQIPPHFIRCQIAFPALALLRSPGVSRAIRPDSPDTDLLQMMWERFHSFREAFACETGGANPSSPGEVIRFCAAGVTYEARKAAREGIRERLIKLPLSESKAAAWDTPDGWDSPGNEPELRPLYDRLRRVDPLGDLDAELDALAALPSSVRENAACSLLGQALFPSPYLPPLALLAKELVSS